MLRTDAICYRPDIYCNRKMHIKAKIRRIIINGSGACAFSDQAKDLWRSKMEEWQKIDFDAIIIGSGPGGATVANELSKSGKRVLILERGHGRPLDGTLLQGFTMGDLRFTQQLLSIIRGITVGGG